MTISHHFKNQNDFMMWKVSISHSNDTYKSLSDFFHSIVQKREGRQGKKKGNLSGPAIQKIRRKKGITHFDLFKKSSSC